MRSWRSGVRPMFRREKSRSLACHTFQMFQPGKIGITPGSLDELVTSIPRPRSVGIVAYIGLSGALGLLEALVAEVRQAHGSQGNDAVAEPGHLIEGERDVVRESRDGLTREQEALEVRGSRLIDGARDGRGRSPETEQA